MRPEYPVEGDDTSNLKEALRNTSTDENLREKPSDGELDDLLDDLEE
mgnify:CR=1 FL=1